MARSRIATNVKQLGEAQGEALALFFDLVADSRADARDLRRAISRRKKTGEGPDYRATLETLSAFPNGLVRRAELLLAEAKRVHRAVVRYAKARTKAEEKAAGEAHVAALQKKAARLLADTASEEGA